MIYRMSNLKQSFFVITVFIFLMAAEIFAQTTAFTYQGKLTDSGIPANATYDMQFTLFDAVSGGIQQGATLTNSTVQVTNGIFAVTLDFGTNVFTGSPRFLEIAVRQAGSPDLYTPLAPLQQIASTPYAIRSLVSTAADSLSIACVNCITSSQIQSVNGSAVSGTIPVASVPAGSPNYIQNTTSQQAAADFNISGNGTAGGTLSGNLLNATIQYNLGGSRVLSNAGTNNLFAGIGAGQANTTGNFNSFFGSNAGRDNSTGFNNTFFGDSAGYSNTTGNSNAFFGTSAGVLNTASSNAFFGTNAGRMNTTGFNNAFFGDSAGLSNTTGNSNAFFGEDAGRTNTASVNAFFGAFAGQANTTGFNNAFFGASAGLSNTTGNANAFFGRFAGFSNTSSFNAFFGAFAGQANTTGIANAFFGQAAGFSNTTGGSNAFFGNGAGGANTAGTFNAFFGTSAGQANTASFNSFFGAFAGQANTTGGANAFFGYQAGVSNTTGGNNAFFGYSAGIVNIASDNSFFGAFAGESNTEGAFNAFFGERAGFSSTTGNFNAFFGKSAGEMNTTGVDNAFFGANAGFSNITGTNNTVIGAFANVGFDNLDHATAIGADAIVTASNLIVLGRPVDTVSIPGTLTKAAGSFKIDHPLDPENKTLSHSFVESLDMKNIYDGVVTLNRRGEASISLPNYFEALNRDFRYQLTCIGGFAPVFIAEEIKNNRFKIAGGKANMKVSWQITGIRHDAYANAHRIPVEEDKPATERGTYLHPDVFKQPGKDDPVSGRGKVRHLSARSKR